MKLNENPSAEPLASIPLGTVAWSRARERVASQDWAAALIDELETGFRRHLKAYPGEPPTEQSEWTHHSYCDDCAAKLEFDLVKPFEHRCPSCGKTYGDPMRNGAWRTRLHNAIMGNVEAAAVLARLQPDPGDYVDFIRKTFLFYAGHYDAYPVHGLRAGKGKVMPQALDEAVWIILAGRCLRWGADQEWFSPSELDSIRNRLFRPAAELLKPQIHKIHNIHVWLNSAVATCAWWMEDWDLFDWTIEGEFGWKRQMDQGVNADGFWWEGSIGYHFYSFNAFASLARTAADAGRSLWGHGRFLQMLLAPLDLAYADGTLPAHNDTWKVGLADYADAYELGAGVWPDAGLDAALGLIYRDRAEHAPELPSPRCSIEALLYGPTVLPDATRKPRTSRHFKASGLGILENTRVRVCMKAGPHGGSHDHRDKLNVDVFAANGWKSEDLGTSGYGAEITTRWYQQPAAHNVPVVNQGKQDGVNGTIVEFGPSRVCGKVEGAYPGVSLSRVIELTPAGWNDLTTIEGSEPAELDWCFHGSGHLETTLPLEPAEHAGTEGGFDRLRNVRVGRTDDAWQVEWRDGTRTVRLSFKGVPGTEVLLASGDGNPVGPELGVLIVRRRAASTCFEGSFEILAS
jgi:hypothetical protein